MSKTIITIRYESDAPYTAQEIEGITTEICDLITDIDGDADASSFTGTAMTEQEEIDAKSQAVVDFLNNAEITSTLSITPEAGGAPITVDFQESTEE